MLLERHLPPIMLEVPRDAKLQLMKDILACYLPEGECNRVQKHKAYRQKLISAYQVASGGIGSGIGNYIGGDSNVAAQLKLKNVSAGDISVNAKYKLLHLSVDGAVVEGRIASTDPKVKAYHVPLSGSYWKVWIDRVFHGEGGVNSTKQRDIFS